MSVTKYDFWKYFEEATPNYFTGVDLLEKVAPDEPLLKRLKKGASTMNRLMLRQAMDRIYKDFPKEIQENKPKAVSKKPKQKKAKKPIAEQKKKLTQEDFKRIADKELAAAYAERRRLSNQFFHCNTDEERANISDLVKACIQNINDLKSRISVYKDKGKMPPKIVVKGFEIPESDVKLIRLIQNYRIKVSSQKKLLRDYDKQGRYKTKGEHELYLSELQNKLKQLENERNRREK